MKQFDMEKLEKAIIYVGRMADGRIPYSNQPIEDGVLNDPNVIRCMFFIEDVLQEVKANEGFVGKKSKKPKAKRSKADQFPFEVLRDFKYKENMPISYVLRQFVELSGDNDTPIISAMNVNKWLASNGYLAKVVVNAEGKENWAPTDQGISLGIIGTESGEPGREYIRIEYNREAQEFLAENLKRITEDCLAGRI